MYADTGMNCILQEFSSRGADKKRLRIHLAGGAEMLNDRGLFSIGRRNHAAIRKVLWHYGLFIDGEQVGGNCPRTLCLRLADGTVTVKNADSTITF